MEKEFIESGFKKESDYPIYLTRKQLGSNHFIEEVGKDNNVWRIWINYGSGNIYIYLGFIRNKKEWDIVQDLLQV